MVRLLYGGRNSLLIAGASTIPTELRFAAQNFGLSGWLKWRRYLLPAVFPSFVTGAITASGGSWNASIVAESVSWGHTTLEAHRECTGSAVAGRLISAFAIEVSHFRKVMPKDYKQVLEVMQQAAAEGLSEEQQSERIMAASHG